MRIIFTLFSVWLLSHSAVTYAEFPEMIEGDSRQIRGPNSPSWLAAVGRSVSELRPGAVEGCSWSLIADSFTKDAVIIVGAGHCVDHWASASGGFDVGSNSINWLTNDGRKISRTIKSILKAETHKGDYAIAKIDRPISRFDIQPLINAPYHYRDLMDPEFVDPNAFATMAGYSADTGIGQKGDVLTYDVCDRVNGGASGLKKAYCHSYEGASGGPLVVTLTLSENFPGQEEDETVLWYFEDVFPDINYGTYHFLVGSIVGARQGDDYSRTMFTETTYYTRILDDILAAH